MDKIKELETRKAELVVEIQNAETVEDLNARSAEMDLVEKKLAFLNKNKAVQENEFIAVETETRSTKNELDLFADKLRALKGVETRADAITLLADINAALPKEVIGVISAKLKEGSDLSSKVTVTNEKFGASIALNQLKFEAKWTADGESSDKQKGKLDSIVFVEKGLEVVIDMSRIAAHQSTEQVIAIFVEAAVKAMKRAINAGIVNGNGTTQIEGILKKTGVKTADTDLTYTSFIALLGKVDFYEGTIIIDPTMFYRAVGQVDKNGQPVARVDHGLDGEIRYSLFGHEVAFAEKGTLSADKFIIANLSGYALNFNQSVQSIRGYDINTGRDVLRTEAILDGKLASKDDALIVTVKAPASGE